MKRPARPSGPDAGQPWLFGERPPVAERAAGGGWVDVGRQASATGFRWPLAVSAELCGDVQTIPPGCGGSETASQRWQHVFLLITPAAAQIIRERLEGLQVNVVLRTTDAPGRSRDHIKALRLTVERRPGSPETFALAYCARK